MKHFCLFVLLLFFVLLSSCRDNSSSAFERLDKAYRYYYISLDSVEHYASGVYHDKHLSGAERSEALNALAFVDVQNMDYQRAMEKYDSVEILTKNSIERLVATIGRMQLCQKKSDNKDFYHYKNKAYKFIKEINEKRDNLSPRELKRFEYARSEYSIVCSIYYYYVGLNDLSRESLAETGTSVYIMRDTAQLLKYYYNIGAGGVIQNENTIDEKQEEMGYLIRCYMLASRHGYIYWQANSMQAISEHLFNPQTRNYLIESNRTALNKLNPDNMPDTLIAGYLAQKALNLFRQYGDVYQVAGANRTLAKCFWQIGDYSSAKLCLEEALNGDARIHQAPDLVASIHEQFSIVYSAINDKQNSDIHRNQYLDIQERTRQDRYLEARKEELDNSIYKQNVSIVLLIATICVVIALITWFYRKNKNRRKREEKIYRLSLPLATWKQTKQRENTLLQEKIDATREQIAVENVTLQSYLEQNVNLRAKMSLAENIIPLISRMVNASSRASSREYMSELIEQIITYNNLLTEWIKLEKGDMLMRIETFALNDVFEIVKHSLANFTQKGVILNVRQTNCCIKADKYLTVFMINTMLDNALKHTEQGGSVELSATEYDNYVEISITDTGEGMTSEQVEKVFSTLTTDEKLQLNEHSHKSFNDSRQQASCKKHGFGILNCRGIIDKYKKVSGLFDVAKIGVESKVGEGSRFFFRLPRGIKRYIVLLLISFSLMPAFASSKNRGSDFADSVYYSNIRGDYKQAIAYADSAIYEINKEVKEKYKSPTDTMVLMSANGNTCASLSWWKSKKDVDFDVILDIRNEVAVAALALHYWDLYEYNNSIYTQLYKELSADKSLEQYIILSSRAKTNRNIALLILLILLLAILPAYYFLYYRHVIFMRKSEKQLKTANQILVSEISDEEKLQEIEQQTSDILAPDVFIAIRDVKTALQQSIKLTNQSEKEYAFAMDNLNKLRHEISRLHVSNNVTSNGLSVLKHETMYYPSKIALLLQDHETNKSTIKEISTYYNNLYTILLKYASNKQSLTFYKIEKIDLNALRQSKKISYHYHSFETNQPDNISVFANKETLEYCIDIIMRQTEKSEMNVDVLAIDDQYLELDLHINSPASRNWNEDELFIPSKKEYLPLLIPKQILKDLGEMTGKRRCGISAIRTNDSDFLIKIILPYSKNKDKRETTPQ